MRPQSFRFSLTELSVKRPRLVSPLPPEIWLYIASFISFAEFKQNRLYALNRPLLFYFLEEEHRNLELRYVWGLGLSDWSCKQLNHLRDGSLASGFPRKLVITFTDQDIIPPTVGRTLSATKTARRIFKYLPRAVTALGSKRARGRRRTSSYTLSSDSASKDAILAILQLNNLSSIKCDWMCVPAWSLTPLDTTFVFATAASWKGSRHTLTSLSLTFREDIFLGGELSNADFPNLSEFELNLSPDFHAALVISPRHDERVIIFRRSLMTFLSTHKTRIKRLVLMAQSCKFTADLLKEIPLLSSLNDLSLHFNMHFDRQILAPLFPFLRQQSIELRILSIRLYTGRSLPANGSPAELAMLATYKSFLDVDLPRLESLSVSLENTPLLAWYLTKIAFKVETLDIVSWLSYLNVQQLIPALRRCGAETQLQHLSLLTTNFTPGLLALLAQGLPHLKSLYIRFFCIVADEESDQYSDSDASPLQTYQKISALKFSDWELERIDLLRYIEWPSGHVADMFSAAIAEALPRVKCINVLGGKQGRGKHT